MEKGSFNYKIAMALVFVIALFVCVQAYGAELKESVKIILESDWSRIILWAYVGGVVVIHGATYRKVSSIETGFIYKHFGVYAEVCFAFATYGFASTTSLALMRGLYLQVFYERVSFSEFDGLDLISMFVLSSFLMVYCLVTVTIMGRDILFYKRVSSVEVKG